MRLRAGGPDHAREAGRVRVVDLVHNAHLDVPALRVPEHHAIARRRGPRLALGGALALTLSPGEGPEVQDAQEPDEVQHLAVHFPRGQAQAAPHQLPRDDLAARGPGRDQERGAGRVEALEEQVARDQAVEPARGVVRDPLRAQVGGHGPPDCFGAQARRAHRRREALRVRDADREREEGPARGALRDHGRDLRVSRVHVDHAREVRLVVVGAAHRHAREVQVRVNCRAPGRHEVPAPDRGHDVMRVDDALVGLALARDRGHAVGRGPERRGAHAQVGEPLRLARPAPRLLNRPVHELVAWRGRVVALVGDHEIERLQAGKTADQRLHRGDNDRRV